MPFQDTLMQRSVGMLNVDSCMSGPISGISSSPVLQDIMMDALKHSDDPTSKLNKFNSFND